ATTGWYREPRNGHALSLALQGYRSDLRFGDDSDSADLRFAWALRPDTGRWIVLNRTDLRYDTRSGALSDYESLRLVNNLHANWQWNRVTQLGLRLGVKQQRATFDNLKEDAFVLLLGADWRRDLGRRFDLGLHAAEWRSVDSDIAERLFGVDIGVTFARNAWVAVGYNFRGIADTDFAAGRFNDAGPYLQLRLKIDQDTFKDLSLAGLRAPERGGASAPQSAAVR
ncbi:MAG: hypothetical protein RML32_07455, partial [Gammaproteobacteria bacterium]|nr:hypothetical protein [Gammaproteobacteria bacterium]